jgi:hypothetical protein
MLTRCLSCYQRFEPNQSLEWLPVGRRVAFDPERGRLWVICGACSRWTLEPMESRWEALVELERLVVDRARLLRQGEAIALFEFGDVAIVRVGRATGREEAWWRYGDEFASRRRRAQGLTRRGKIIDAIIMLGVTGIPFWGHSNAEAWIERGRRRSFGRESWRGVSRCPKCGHQLGQLWFEERGDLHLEAADDGIQLWYSCPTCGSDDPLGGHRLKGLAAEHVLRRSLAYENFAGGSEAMVDAAMSLVGRSVAPHLLIERAAAERTPLARLSAPRSLALEIALNGDVEARLLAAEVADLEERWREEEELASIIDGQLTPLAGRPPGRDRARSDEGDHS